MKKITVFWDIKLHTELLSPSARKKRKPSMEKMIQRKAGPGP
jgi:hypothetical protein